MPKLNATESIVVQRPRGFDPVDNPNPEVKIVKRKLAGGEIEEIPDMVTYVVEPNTVFDFTDEEVKMLKKMNPTGFSTKRMVDVSADAPAGTQVEVAVKDGGTAPKSKVDLADAASLKVAPGPKPSGPAVKTTGPDGGKVAGDM